MTFQPHHQAPADRGRLIGQGTMREKPIQKQDIAGRASKRARRRVWEHLLRQIKLPLGGLLVGVGLLIYAWQHFQRPVGVGGIHQWYPAGHHDWTVRIRRILMPRTAGLRKTRDIHPHTDDLPSELPRGRESRHGVHQPWMLGQAGDTRVLVRIGKDAMDERDCVSTVQLRNAFQALHQGQLWAARLIRGEKSARKTVNSLRDAGLQLVDLGRGKNPCADGIATWGDRHGGSPYVMWGDPPQDTLDLQRQSSLLYQDSAGSTRGFIQV